jgi:hypothetical protein
MSRFVDDDESALRGESRLLILAAGSIWRSIRQMWTMSVNGVSFSVEIQSSTIRLQRMSMKSLAAWGAWRQKISSFREVGLLTI